MAYRQSALYHFWMLFILIGCGQPDSDRQYVATARATDTETDEQFVARTQAEEQTMLAAAGIADGLSEETPAGFALSEMTPEAKAQKYSMFIIRYCSSYVYASQFYNRDREFCSSRRVKVGDCQDVNTLLNHPLHKRYQDDFAQINVRLANQFGADAWNGETWVQETTSTRYERSPYYFENMYFAQPSEEVTETHEVSFGQLARVGTITATVRGVVVAEVTTDGESAAVVEITTKKNASVVWTNSFNFERIITFQDGDEALNDHEGIGHKITFELPRHNFDEPCDVNGNDEVTSRDQLAIANALNRNGQSALFVDFNADGSLDAEDSVRWAEMCNTPEEPVM